MGSKLLVACTKLVSQAALRASCNRNQRGIHQYLLGDFRFRSLGLLSEPSLTRMAFFRVSASCLNWSNSFIVLEGNGERHEI